MKTKMLAVMSLALLVSACASRPDAIAPANVSALEYSTLSCKDTRYMLSQKRQEQDILSSKQSRAATADAVSVFFVLVPLGTVFGSDVEGKLATAKGEVLALERAVQINCSEK